MAEWKSRGYVPDSDEEEDSQELVVKEINVTEASVDKREVKENISQSASSQVRVTEVRIPTNQRAYPNGNKPPGSYVSLQSFRDDEADIDELQQDHYNTKPDPQSGGQVAQEPRTFEVASNDVHSVPSNASSPLSEPLSLPDLAQFVTLPESAEIAKSPITSQRSISNVRYISSVQTQTSTQPRSSRNLRQRNPIQLHPYAIESEKYRQTLHARGLKALRFAQQDSQALAEEGSQDQEFITSPPSTSPYLKAQTATHLSPSSQNDTFLFAEDEFPDVESLLRHQTSQYEVHAHKRRRITKPPSVLPARARKLSIERDPFEDDECDVYDVPVSPPHSGGLASNDESRSETPRFKVPKRITPAALPTPITSSEPRRPSISSFFGQNDSEEHTNIALELSDESESSPVAAEGKSNSQLQHVQRRIRGVLPASWLKLDVQAQVKESNMNRRERNSTSPEKRDLHRGVARPVSRRKGSSGLLTPLHETFTVSDDDGESNTNEEQQSDGIPSLQMMDGDNEDSVFNRRFGEALEDDEIDAMLPTTNRAPNRSRKYKKRQKRLSDFVLQPSKSSREHKRPYIDRTIEARMSATARPPKTFPPKIRSPRLSILDASSLSHEIPTSPPPFFFNIATRTARLRRDKGRHSPSRKYIRLATREDDNDANQILRSWKEGFLAPQNLDSLIAKQPRKPLHPRSGNIMLPLDASKARTLPLYTKQIASKRLKLTAKPRRRHTQSSLDALIPRQSEDAAPAFEVKQLQDVAQSNPSTSYKGKLISSLRNGNDFRPAMLETLQEADDQTHPKTAFQRDLSLMAQPRTSSRKPAPLWNRFLDETIVMAPSQQHVLDQPHEGEIKHQGLRLNNRSINVRRKQKRRPRRLDIFSNFNVKFDDPSPVVSLPIREDCYDQSEDLNFREYAIRLTGLGIFGTQYTSHFDITPFPKGTCFHQKTFLGSGEFNRSLGLMENDMDQHRGFAVFIYEQDTFRWGPWNEVVSTELGMLCEKLAKAVQNQPNWENFERLLNLQRHVANYTSNHLSFFDPVDRLSFLKRCTHVVKSMATEATADLDLRIRAGQHDLRDGLVSVQTFYLVIANQLRLLSKHVGVSDLLKQEAVSFVSDCAELLQHSLSARLKVPEDLMSMSRRNVNNNLLIQDDPAVEALVIARHVLNYDGFVRRCFWESMLLEKFTIAEDADFFVSSLETSWQKVFRVLPSVEFDKQGVLVTGQRFETASDNWTVIQKLISPVFEIYTSKATGQIPSLNTYCRSLFSRCLCLINTWGWHRCDSIIGILFDFFARNNLNHLQNEHSHGSALFLENLSQTITLTAEAEDRCFHLLLKIIGSGIRHMHQIYPEKKIRDLVWRLMPNHGRFHPKEEAIHQEDVDALRNHHDLLCTLYWASPPGFRPRLSVIRNLVHVESSHKEVCHINIRAWSNLVRFQLSTNEPIESIKPFTMWHDDLLDQILRQHGLARTEAEDEVKSIQNAQGLLVPRELLESTIARNQRQVESLLCDALTCLNRAVQNTRSKDAADTLVSLKLNACFAIFDAARIPTSNPIIEALDVVMSYIKRCSELTNDNDDSQDYGDWTAFTEDDARDVVAQPEYSLLEGMHDPIRHLLSNCFGADLKPPDNLLSKVVQVWAAVAQKLVTLGKKSWSDYIGDYGKDAWRSLRDTEQTSKYTSYFFASLIGNDVNVYKENKSSFLRFWIESLVERESLLKFQHRLTCILLNSDPENALLSNPPFWKSKSPNQFDITTKLFSERRLSLIINTLSNMRTSLQCAQAESVTNAERLKQEYKDLLKHLMIAMKHNYEELGHAATVKGVYVDFVHVIIESLQQHVSNICPVDRFFTDNVSFPLPATDPTYVVAQLKSYGLRLQNPRTPKELAIFLQSVSTRAAIDNQQAYLIDHLCDAMSNGFEDCSSSPTLRAAIVKDIVPAYLEMAFQTACGWLLTLPFLKALEKIFKKSLEYMDGLRASSTKSMATLVSSFLSTMKSSFTSILDVPAILQKASILRTLRLCFHCITALLPTLDYLIRLGEIVLTASQCIEGFKSFADCWLLNQSIKKGEDLFNVSDANAGKRAESESEIQKFVATELRQTLERNWICVDDHYFVVRGSSRKELVVDVGLLEEEEEMLMKSLRCFSKQQRSMPALGTEDDISRHDTSVIRGLEDLMI